MASLAASSSQLFLRPKIPELFLPCSSTPKPLSFLNSPCLYGRRGILIVSAAKSSSKSIQNDTRSQKSTSEDKKVVKEDEEIEVEEELPWIQEKALDLVEFTGSVTQAIPGPRVGQSSLPWILALPLAYAGVTFVIAFVKTVKKFSSPREKRRRLVNKNAMLCKSIDELLQKGGDALEHSALKALENKTGFSMEDIFRKYIRYALNEKPFNPELVANLIQLRKASMLDDSLVAEILNDISRRIVKEKGPVVMDVEGYTEKGFKRKLAVQALFGKVYYLSELPEFCSRGSSLIVKEIFGVTDEDAYKLRMHTLSEAGDVDSLEKMIDGSDSEDSDEHSSNVP
ncbi:hypothetical protein JCGZ_24462 [Jatropha curcas]|uniref:Armadillo-like repeats domain-containing protein n=1 Tax=Jatropha curcas TaxID=180498 RepID=A0A067KZP8_JATCU|nr:uncharacterized protein LOC105631153 [Jatropha curcas]KDP40463.1 hypothetical protein JCGZ_24462 [Jatropha curcas]